MATILTPTADNVRRAADALRRGELIGLPTETVYGLAANAFDAAAVARIFAAKERPSFDPLIVHVVRPEGPLEREVLGGLEDIGVVSVKGLPQLARERADVLLRKFWPGPLTLVLPRGKKIPDLVTSGLDTVAIRMPSHPVAQALLKAAEIPLAAPSANRFGRISPTTAAHVVEELGERVGIVLDGGACTVGVESTVVAISPSGALTLLRPGGIAAEAIEAAAHVRLAQATAPAAGKPAPSPGMSEVHYAPRTPLFIAPGPDALPRGATNLGLIGVFADGKAVAKAAAEAEKRYALPVVTRALTQSGDLEEAARNLFTMLRELDAGDVSAILAYPPQGQEGLALAISDRLRRASH
ncbi:MAG TPA: L-threonylcarbamoyladenylate synthase [Candidatus Polarisedimenticolaceae bacterium]|nr:L-threonylcarbamoyladenylate synthase [Candidatus Polarisedimenticolaceae bacterium]